MGFRFYKRVKIAPGVSINMSRSGPSISVGPRGMKHTIGPRGSRTTLGIPGTGLYYTTTSSGKSSKRASGSGRSAAGANAGLPDMGFLKSLFASPGEKEYVNGMKRFVCGDMEGAKAAFESSGLLDSQFMAGYIALGKYEYEVAMESFERCLEDASALGQIQRKLVGSELETLLEITDYIEAPISMDKRGLYLALAECCQHTGRLGRAIGLMEELWEENPSDKVVCLSVMEIVTMWEGASAQNLKDMLEMTKTVENEDPIDTNILYLRSYALYRLDMVEGGISQLTQITRRKKGRPKELMLDIRYLRGQMYEETGQRAKARKDFETIYAQDPSYEDVAEKLGI